MTILIRPLAVDDWQIFKAIRLQALAECPGNYCGTFAQAQARSDADWQAMLTREDACAFGLFDGDRLVGITSVFTRADDPSGATASYGMSYIAPCHRGAGLAAQLYKARIEWALARDGLRRITVSTRADNHASRKGMERAGFTRIATSQRVWPDGVEAEEWEYELDLGSIRQA